MTSSFISTIKYIASIAPTLDKPSEFIDWAEDICLVVSHVFGVDYDTVTEAVFEAVKAEQGWEDKDEE